MTHIDFLENAQSIFESFPNEQVWAQGGLQPKRQLQKPEAGYCVVFRYDEKITSVITHFMAKIHSTLPNLLTYNAENLHTTIGTYGKTDMKEFVSDSTIIRRLEESLEKGLSGHSGNILIEFGKWLYNEEAILIPGYPNQELWHLIQSIGNICQENGLSLDMGRIMHITTARFTENVSFQTFEAFSSIMKTAPVLNGVKPIAIDLATWSCDGLIFNLIPHKHFIL